MMKKQIVLGAFISAFAIMASCKKNDGTISEPINEDSLIVLTGDIETQTLKADHKYLLNGQVFVRDGHVLTIEPGTIIMGQKKSKGTLIIDRGAKIIAEGTVDKPIVFTSNQAVGDRDRGDWGGLVILGKARVNIPNPSIEGIEPQVHYGGIDDDDNSGILKYVRVEFAGIELTPNNETNAITFAGVGRGTTVENVMVSYGGDDGFEFFGGCVNAKNLVAFATWDDCFDFDNGYSGNLQFGLSIRYPSYADQSESNAFEWDTNGNNEVTDQPTTATVSNFTIIGPCIDGNAIAQNYRYGLDLRRRVAANLFNSVIVGFPNAVRMNQSTVFPNYQNGQAQIANNVFYAKSTSIVSGASEVSTTDILNYLTSNDNIVDAGSDFQTSAAYLNLGIKPELFFNKKLNTQYPAHPNFSVTSGLITTGARFDYDVFNEMHRSSAFNKSVSYLGAFGGFDWTQGWTNFDPINQPY
jgi:hypothetical protein